MNQPLPVIDLHCDLLHYLAHFPGASIDKAAEIGVALPHLQAGHVRLQVLAMFTMTQPGSVASAARQSQIYADLVKEGRLVSGRSVSEIESALTGAAPAVVAAIESASGLCEEHEPITLAFERLESILDKVGRLLYISFTHHTENRFGGGNFSNNVGLKPDGMSLLDYLNGKEICVDLSHSSDALAEEIFNYVSKYRLDIPIIASHSNFRPLHPHVRNLPDELADEIIQQGGIIGLNVLRDYIHPTDHRQFFEHILYGLQRAPQSLAFGADYFCTLNFPDKDRFPLFYRELEDASCYPYILDEMRKQVGEEALRGLAYENVMRFLKRIWEN